MLQDDPGMGTITLCKWFLYTYHGNWQTASAVKEFPYMTSTWEGREHSEAEDEGDGQFRTDNNVQLHMKYSK